MNMRPPNKSTLLKVVILGDGGVGKSCLMNRFVSNRYDENNFHTIGVEFMNKDVNVDGEKYTLQVSDKPSFNKKISMSPVRTIICDKTRNYN